MDADPQSETILQEADRVTSADRQRYYGHPLDNHRCTAEFWQSFLIRRGWTPPPDGMNVRDVCTMNGLQKYSRDANQPKRDNLVDVCGYARNAEQAQEESLRRLNEQGLAKIVPPAPPIKIPAIEPLVPAHFEYSDPAPDCLPKTQLDCDEHDHGRPY